MRKNELHEAMERMHAAEDTYERVMERASAGCRRGRGSLPAAAVIGVAVAGVLATGGVAYAVAGGDFFDRVWGDYGTDGRVEWSYMGNNYSQEYGSLDPAAVSDDLASSVEAVGLSVTGNGYTLTIEDMLVDENGCGVASFTLENPDGLQNNPEYGLPVEFVPADDAPLDSLGMFSTGEGVSGLIDARWVYDQELSTDTAARGTVYFSTFGSLDNVLSGVFWSLSWHTGEVDENGAVPPDYANLEECSDAFVPSKVVGAREFAGEDGSVATVSPFSIHVDAAWKAGGESGTDKVVLHLADGSTYVVVSDGDESANMNYYTANLLEDRTVKYTFTRLVNVSDVVSVEISGAVGDPLSGEETHAATLVPAA